MTLMFTMLRDRYVQFVVGAITVFIMLVLAVLMRTYLTLFVIWLVADVVLIKVTKLDYRLCIWLLLILTGIEFAIIDAFLVIVYIFIVAVSCYVLTANVEHEQQALFFLYISSFSPFVAVIKIYKLHRFLWHWLLALLSGLQLALPDVVLLIVYIVVTVIVLYRYVFITDNHHEEARAGAGGRKGRLGRSGDRDEEKEDRRQQLLLLQLQTQYQRQQQQLQQLQQQQLLLVLQPRQQQQQQQQQGESNLQCTLSTRNDKNATRPTTNYYHDNDCSDVCDYDYNLSRLRQRQRGLDHRVKGMTQ